MTAFTFDSNIVSDLHKDAYGFRPSQGWYESWDQSTDAEKQQVWDDLIVALDREIADEKAREQESVLQFEALVAKNIELGAKDRATALRWIMDASEANGDWERLCYLNYLPSQYFKKTA